jgi:hypothetical protein
MDSALPTGAMRAAPRKRGNVKPDTCVDFKHSCRQISVQGIRFIILNLGRPTNQQPENLADLAVAAAARAATMRRKPAAPSKAHRQARANSFAAPACALPIVWPAMFCTARGPDLQQNQATGTTSPVDQSDTIESQNMEQKGWDRRVRGETNEIRVKRRLIEITSRTVHKSQLDFFAFCFFVPACLGNGFYTIG